MASARGLCGEGDKADKRKFWIGGPVGCVGFVTLMRHLQPRMFTNVRTDKRASEAVGSNGREDNASECKIASNLYGTIRMV